MCRQAFREERSLLSAVMAGQEEGGGATGEQLADNPVAPTADAPEADFVGLIPRTEKEAVLPAAPTQDDPVLGIIDRHVSGHRPPAVSRLSALKHFLP